MLTQVTVFQSNKKPSQGPSKMWFWSWDNSTPETYWPFVFPGPPAGEHLKGAEPLLIHTGKDEKKKHANIVTWTAEALLYFDNENPEESRSPAAIGFLILSFLHTAPLAPPSVPHTTPNAFFFFFL